MPTLDAIGLVAADLPATLSFYRLLGLDIPAADDDASHVEVELAGGFRLMFDPISTVESFTTYEPPTGGRNHGLAFRCSSPAEVDEVHAAVVAAGHPSKVAPFDAFWGQRYATVVDPDGTPVDLYAALG